MGRACSCAGPSDTRCAGAVQCRSGGLRGSEPCTRCVCRRSLTDLDLSRNRLAGELAREVRQHPPPSPPGCVRAGRTAACTTPLLPCMGHSPVGLLACERTHSSATLPPTALRPCPPCLVTRWGCCPACAPSTCATTASLRCRPRSRAAPRSWSSSWVRGPSRPLIASCGRHTQAPLDTRSRCKLVVCSAVVHSLSLLYMPSPASTT
jgi:hypothetical protein